MGLNVSTPLNNTLNQNTLTLFSPGQPCMTNYGKKDKNTPAEHL